MYREDIYNCVADLKNRYAPNPCSVLFAGPPDGRLHIKHIFKLHQFFTIDKSKTADYHPVSDSDIDEWRIPSDSFDVVIATDILNKHPLFWRLLKNIADVCRPDGYIFLVISSVSLKNSHQLSEFCYLFSEKAVEGWAEYMTCELVEQTRITNIITIVMKKNNI